MLGMSPANAGHHESEEQPKSDLTVAVDQFMDALKESVEMFDSIMAKDSDMVTFGTDASERWADLMPLEILAKQVGVSSRKIDTKDQVIKMAISGKVACLAGCRLADC